MSKAILGLAPTMQSLALIGGTAKRLKKKRKHLGGLVEGATGILVGVPLISETSNIVSGF